MADVDGNANAPELSSGDIFTFPLEQLFRAPGVKPDLYPYLTRSSSPFEYECLLVPTRLWE